MYTYLYVCICIYIYTCYICTFVIAGSYNTCRLRHIFGHMFSFNVHSIKSSMIFLKTQVSGGFFTSQLYFTIYHAVFMGEPTHFRLGEVSCSSQTVSHYQRVTSSKVFNITFIWTPDLNINATGHSGHHGQGQPLAGILQSRWHSTCSSWGQMCSAVSAWNSEHFTL